MFLAGITGSELTPCEGYIAKLQKRSAKKLTQFREDLRLLLITRDIVYWDYTVVYILAQRACLRFYGDEQIGSRYGSAFERALLRRITKYMRNYFMWFTDFSIPVTNNLSERGLRGQLCPDQVLYRNLPQEWNK